MSRTVYVVGGHAPYGGAWMAYHVGKILNHEFGYDLRVIEVGRVGDQRPMQQFVDSCADLVREDDVLVCNPSFSMFNLGLKVRGRKLMYVQGFTTFSVLDCFFDRYVAVSGFVRGFLDQTYGIDAPVIPAFVPGTELDPPDAARLNPVTPWQARPPYSIELNLKGVKGDVTQQVLLLDRVRRALRGKDRALEESIDWEAALERARVKLPRDRFLQRIASARYLLTLSVAEGFGLVPLEAMGMGTVVLGFDGYGGREYMVPEQNCAVAAYPDVSRVVDGMIRAMRDPEFSGRIATAGIETASRYTYASFRGAWVRELKSFLSR